MKILPLPVPKRLIMSEIRLLSVLVFIIGLILPTAVSAQVPVEVSNEKMIYGGKVYRVHEVLKNQTLYSIARAYKVTIPEIERENEIPASGIQEGNTLRIPVREDLAETQALPRNVTQPASQPASQPAKPVASGNGPSYDPATGIRISSEKIIFSGKSYYMHEVMKGQTLYSIAKAYRVTILDIDRENAIPAGGIQAGQVLRIPVASSMIAQKEGAAAPADAQAEAEVRQLPATQSQPPAGQQSSPAVNQTSGASQSASSTTRSSGSSQPSTGSSQSDMTSQPAAVTTQPAETSQPADEVKQTEAAPRGPAATPKPEARKPQPEKKKIHKVQKGESLADIAKKYGLSVQELKQANKGVIFAMPDMRLVIPGNGDQEKEIQ